MNEQEQGRVHLTLDDVLDAYVTAVPHPDRTHLQEWIGKYPEFGDELTQFTMDWIAMEWAPRPSDVPPEQTLVLRGASVVQGLLQRLDQKGVRDRTVAPIAIQSIVDEAKRQGLTAVALADGADLNLALIRKFDRRLFKASSVPVLAIQRLAHALGRALADIEDYLRRQQVMAAGARYKSAQTPALSELEDFFQAVHDDPTLSEERRQFWLSLAPPHTRQDLGLDELLD